MLADDHTHKERSTRDWSTLPALAASAIVDALGVDGNGLRNSCRTFTDVGMTRAGPSFDPRRLVCRDARRPIPVPCRFAADLKSMTVVMCADPEQTRYMSELPDKKKYNRLVEACRIDGKRASPQPAPFDGACELELAAGMRTLFPPRVTSLMGYDDETTMRTLVIVLPGYKVSASTVERTLLSASTPSLERVFHRVLLVAAVVDLDGGLRSSLVGAFGVHIEEKTPPGGFTPGVGRRSYPHMRVVHFLGGKHHVMASCAFPSLRQVAFKLPTGPGYILPTPPLHAVGNAHILVLDYIHDYDVATAGLWVSVDVMRQANPIQALLYIVKTNMLAIMKASAGLHQFILLVDVPIRIDTDGHDILIELPLGQGKWVVHVAHDQGRPHWRPAVLQRIQITAVKVRE